MEKSLMKKVLVITYYWPPGGGAGVQRWLKFVKYFRDFGWEPVLYIPENPEYPERDESLVKDVPSEITILRQSVWEPYFLYKKLAGRRRDEKISPAFLSENRPNRLVENLSVWIRGNFFIPDARMFWIRPSVRFLLRYLADHPVDVIVSTGPPHSLHMIAQALSLRLNLPWLADFRDPWTNIDFYGQLKLSGFADRKHRRFERNVLQNATAVTVISNSMAEDFNRILVRNYEVITNGFDEEDITYTPKLHLDSKFTLAHIGTLVRTRNPESLWIALTRLLSIHPEIKNVLEIKLVGKVDYTVIASIEDHGLTPYLNHIPYLPHDKAVMVQRQAQVLLLIINETPNAKMILTGKFFEYLAARRPILCIGPLDGDAAEILRNTKAGLISDYGDSSALEKQLLRYFQSYREGQLECSGIGIESYSRKHLTGIMSAILDRITDSNSSV